MSKDKRITLVIPAETHANVKHIADTKHTNVSCVIRRYIKLGIMIDQLEGKHDTSFIVRCGDTEKEILFI